MKLKPANSGLGDIAYLCVMRSLLSQITSGVTSLTKSGVTTIDGQAALKITGTGEGQVGYVYVTDTAQPELLRVQAPVQGGTGGQLDFTYTGLPRSITPPPASKTVNGSHYGLV